MKKKPLKVGRPPIPDKKKKVAKIFINMTEEQKEKLVKISERDDVSLSNICIQALKKCGII